LKESIGHLDVVVNGGVLQPGCQTDRFLSPELLLQSSNKTVTSHERQVVNQKSLTGYVLASSCSHTKAHKYYEEIGVGIDFTARDLQEKLKEKGLPWEKSKAFDGSAVIGNFLPKSNFNSLENLTFELTRNGNTVQKGDTRFMLWKIDELIAYVSQFFTLKIGDIIFTGTPEGVGSVAPEDVLEGFLEGTKLFRIQVK
jgi:2-keto-4-pentenoate hydratase/2-oxohepta-3-ene-1,7-dioic acid hydratase in catechol pathway